MKVKRCFSFSDTNNTVQLVDDNGCADPKIVSPFTYDRTKGTAEAKIFSMFKFPESSRVHFQCDIIICRGTYRRISFPIRPMNVFPVFPRLR